MSGPGTVSHIGAAVTQWSLADRRFDGIPAQDVIAVLDDLACRHASVVVHDAINGTVEFGRANLANPRCGQQFADVSVAELIEAARARVAGGAASLPTWQEIARSKKRR